MGYYQNPGPIAWPDERFVPVPGWGMRPELAGPRVIALGLDLPIQTPVGTYNVSVPVELAAKAVADAAWPILQKQLEAEAPKLAKLAVDSAWPSLQAKLQATAPKRKPTHWRGSLTGRMSSLIWKRTGNSR